jgi:hypothetical protein
VTVLVPTTLPIEAAFDRLQAQVRNLGSLVDLGRRTLSPTDRASPPISFASVARILLKDYRLVCFTVGGGLSAVAFGQFTGYISQYLVTTSTAQFTYQVINYRLMGASREEGVNAPTAGSPS